MIIVFCRSCIRILCRSDPLLKPSPGVLSLNKSKVLTGASRPAPSLPLAHSIQPHQAHYCLRPLYYFLSWKVLTPPHTPQHPGKDSSLISSLCSNNIFSVKLSLINSLLNSYSDPSAISAHNLHPC